ncbi:sensor histidine kinase [Paraglaciecola sp. 2405UD69-4]|uniref:sensor histidine kinase n=1 Tax=Paraglaciecola sp. 2405UD69-4 TaxID=3391836 RepID=UPI0039C962AE
MLKDDEMIDFSTVLGSAVHDMKNSLCLLNKSIEDINHAINQPDSKTSEFLASAHYEAARLNTGLVQLLSLYRARLNNLPVNIEEHYIADLIDDLVASNKNYLNHKNMSLEVNKSADLLWYLDSDLICILLNDVLINALRYGENKIILSVYEENQNLVFKIEDDGPGYPKSMLNADLIDMQAFDIRQGRTGLGLFFAHLIAKAHSKSNQAGFISLTNGGALGGSVFVLSIP